MTQIANFPLLRPATGTMQGPQRPQAPTAPTARTSTVASVSDITRIYRDALGRDPEAGGLQYWTRLARNNNLSGDQVRQRIMTSDEYRARQNAAVNQPVAPTTPTAPTAPTTPTAPGRPAGGGAQPGGLLMPPTIPATAGAVTARPPQSNIPAARWNASAMPYEETVEGRLERILGSDSPLMKRAETAGLQQANRRGLLNSSLAAGAAQAEMIDRAAPIASQDAEISARRVLQADQGLINADLERQEFDQRNREQRFERGTNFGLAEMEDRRVRDAANLETATTLETTDRNNQNALDRTRIGEEGATTRAVIQDEGQTTRTLIGEDGATERNLDNLATNEAIAQMEISQEDRDVVARLASGLISDANQQIVTIQSNPDVAANTRTQTIQSIRADTEQSILLLEGLYNIDLNWALSEVYTGPTTPGIPGSVNI